MRSGQNFLQNYVSWKNLNFDLEIKKYFTSVIDWIDRTFKSVDSTMCGLEWGRLYEEYKKRPYDINKLDDRI